MGTRYNSNKRKYCWVYNEKSEEEKYVKSLNLMNI